MSEILTESSTEEAILISFKKWLATLHCFVARELTPREAAHPNLRGILKFVVKDCSCKSGAVTEAESTPKLQKV
ncbi:MAG: hypothetical protein HXX20_23905 [Chloroflexi bacterium]|nr:hypothetical protein [Chloroflexota bacterium]